ncbi:hypothetical protein ONE63_003534 [Megalurothrips usitatus]|uniref:Peptidase metallopeptidase domain-containing protein n=1 Tax=Megalurothrips usitatus TaxID=439358 RepID=A0AAV7X6Q2_9NEOP|nr:hypothetical protein ONE63_003534 [Megalurothrips usitatus]
MCSAVPADGAPVPPSFAVEYLRSLKFIGDVGDPSSGLVTPEVIRDAQAELGLARSGVLDGPTLDLFSKPRCGVSPHWLGGAHSSPRSRRFSTIGSRNEIVTYKVSAYSANLSMAEVDMAVEGAFRRVESATLLRFARAPPSAATWNIDIAFVPDEHGCVAPFGATVLAHALAPKDGGDFHLKDSVDFRVNSLDYVASHELLHSIGVGHSVDPGSLMYPVYRDVSPGSDLLSADDRDVLALLYSRP